MKAPGAGPVLAERPRGVAVLRLRGHDVAHYNWEPDLPLSTSPRPYLHPVRTLAGTTVTDAAPDSHSHQFGISVAFPDIDGRNFWGGRTFVAGHGPAWLDNHGTQRHQRWLRRTGTELTHTLHWVGPHATTLLAEERSITCRALGETAWSLGVRTRLTNVTGAPLPIRSPAALGRVGAGFGGIFWRGPAVSGAPRVLSPAVTDLGDGPGTAGLARVPGASGASGASGVAGASGASGASGAFSAFGADVGRVHGATAPWIAVTGADRDRGEWTLVFTPGDETTARDRWFVRARDYLGVCSSPTWDEPLVLAPGETIARHVVIVVADGAITPGTAAELADIARPR
ncbi:Methane oxygenase PmoA [Nonomuraea solani]|uniref:Methane oxygenase PmoA n=1 Tax=Nonomuraea solani TaxID=1144553 RepID=A0A1H6E4L2_9ACTN|nr:PmoA family protein [Nonomuraea solani]SEG91944.1 Methane oxygenase PmoA [Nonomuraea solani]